MGDNNRMLLKFLIFKIKILKLAVTKNQGPKRNQQTKLQLLISVLPRH